MVLKKNIFKAAKTMLYKTEKLCGVQKYTLNFNFSIL